MRRARAIEPALIPDTVHSIDSAASVPRDVFFLLSLFPGVEEMGERDGSVVETAFDTLEIETIVLCNFTDLEELIVFITRI